MSNRGQGRRGPGLLIRLAVILLIGGGGALYIAMRRPTRITEDQVRAMLASNELIGLPMGRAAERLQHKAGYLDDGTLTLDFAQIDGWTAGPVVLDVHDGIVKKAYWQRDAPKEN